ncbi:thioesterase family protein, putative [Cordyceps militaris CM01]|uniref:Thioesterase family protein, putative n=1 Tax=Cordyceps militaris (strain CM01) TaxID=983644 RepID=G3J8H6_CORMM|nr:thioesterase family protein, putative [Cordyceps militaris CM01]EGX94763.1 thioesterase family protein, putative [Cordyceps militaris CM01]
MEVNGTPEERIQMFLEFTSKNNTNWQSRISPHVELVSVRPDGPHPGVTFSFTVDECHNNASGNMHGGAIATLFDWATSMPLALVCKPGFWSFMGVSRNLDVSYLRPAPVGTECLVECDIVSVGRNMAMLRGTLRRKSDGVILATCSHDKVNTDPPVSKL